jgi:hypothetical protein
LLTFFAGRAVNALPVPVGSSSPALVPLSFAIAFPHAFAAALFLGVVEGFGAFRGSEISAQSEPGDVDPPAPSSAIAAKMSSEAGGSAPSPPPYLDSQDALECKILCVPGLPDH